MSTRMISLNADYIGSPKSPRSSKMNKISSSATPSRLRCSASMPVLCHVGSVAESVKDDITPCAGSLPNQSWLSTIDYRLPRAVNSPSIHKRVTRKNSSMTPVIPDLKVMSKLNEEITEDVEDNAQLTKEKISQESDNEQFVKAPKLSECTESESTAAWLAAATKSLIKNDCKPVPSEDTNNTTPKTYKPFSTVIESPLTPITPPSKQLKTVSVRRTSILRSHSLGAHEKKLKNVRFADSMGLDLVDVQYIKSPQVNTSQIRRRYSLYDEIESHQKLAPRHELVASNFTSPSLQLSFSSRLKEQSVMLHSLTTAETNVYGIVSVMNLHFEKKVIVRYTFDNWQNSIEREASYMLGSHNGVSDKFSFAIFAKPEDFKNIANTPMHPLYTLADKKLFFAVRFETGDGRQFWDNNDGRNYCIKLNTY